MTRGHKHGLRYTPEYRVWVRIKQATTNPSSPDYGYYGGRGITVCPEWINDPFKFIKDVGKRPTPGHQLDRIDNNGNYCKENCHWVTKTKQMRNTRISKWWFVDGVKYDSLSHAAIAHGVVINTIKKWCDGRSDGGYEYPPRDNCWSELKYG